MGVNKVGIKNWKNNFAKLDLISIGEYFFYAALMMETLFVLLDKSAYIIQHETWLFRFTFLMFAVKIATTKYSVKEWMALIGMIIIGYISYVATDREELVRIIALVAACKNVDYRKITKVVFWETLVGSLIIVALSLFGIYGAISVTAHFRGGGIEETRYCLGMGHPNALHCMFLVVLILGLTVYDKQMKWYGYVGAFVGNILFYLLTDSRTSVLITAVAILLAAVIHYAKFWREKYVIYILAIVFLIVCVLFSVFIAKVGVEYPILRQIDIRINGRFQWARHDGAIEYWSMFSRPENEIPFDMGYVKLFYRYGYIPAIIFLVMLVCCIWNCRKKQAFDAFVVIMTFVAYSMIEAHAVSAYIGRNYVFFYLWTLCFISDAQEYNLYDIGKVWIKKWNRIFK